MVTIPAETAVKETSQVYGAFFRVHVAEASLTLPPSVLVWVKLTVSPVRSGKFGEDVTTTVHFPDAPTVSWAVQVAVVMVFAGTTVKTAMPELPACVLSPL